MKNSIFVIRPYFFAGTWVFDDAQKGLEKEPFVSGIPEIISNEVRGISNAEKGFRLLFSANSFPNYSVKLSWVREESGGNWYRTNEGAEGWLCPALFHYFTDAPANIFAKVEPL